MSEDTQIKLICFDIDDTLIERNSWQALNLAMGITKEEDQEMHDAYSSDNLPYDEWIERLSAFYRQNNQATRENIERTLFAYEFKDGVEETISYLKNKGYKIAVLTGSFDMLAQHIVEKLQLDAYKGNSKIIFNNNGTFEQIKSEGDEVQNKPPHLMEICNSLDITPDECVCVGDGINDVEMFKLAGKGVTLTGAPDELEKLAWKTVGSIKELQELL